MNSALFRPAAMGLVVALAAGAIGCGHAQTVGEKRNIQAAPGEEERIFEPGPGFVAQSPADVFRAGAIQAIEQALIEKGYLNPRRDQTIPPETTEAIVRFQRDSKVPATGFPDSDTLRLLGFDPDAVYRGREEVPTTKRK
jgi:peptidoglycan hydrolase-like protein with peptidoglycan-binding domain